MTEKQQRIVEMAKDICRVKLNCNDVCNPISACDALKYAERAVEAGYKKQSEVAREIFEEIEKIIEKHHSECYEYEDGDECDTAITYISYLSVDIDDLKKKYTEGTE